MLSFSFVFIAVVFADYKGQWRTNTFQQGTKILDAKKTLCTHNITSW